MGRRTCAHTRLSGEETQTGSVRPPLDVTVESQQRWVPRKDSLWRCSFSVPSTCGRGGRAPWEASRPRAAFPRRSLAPLACSCTLQVLGRFGRLGLPECLLSPGLGQGRSPHCLLLLQEDAPRRRRSWWKRDSGDSRTLSRMSHLEVGMRRVDSGVGMGQPLRGAPARESRAGVRCRGAGTLAGRPRALGKGVPPPSSGQGRGSGTLVQASQDSGGRVQTTDHVDPGAQTSVFPPVPWVWPLPVAPKTTGRAGFYGLLGSQARHHLALTALSLTVPSPRPAVPGLSQTPRVRHV